VVHSSSSVQKAQSQSETWEQFEVEPEGDVGKLSDERQNHQVLESDVFLWEDTALMTLSRILTLALTLISLSHLIAGEGEHCHCHALSRNDPGHGLDDEQVCYGDQWVTLSMLSPSMYVLLGRLVHLLITLVVQDIKGNWSKLGSGSFGNVYKGAPRT